MDIRRFTELANAYGAARERWPEQERALYDRFAASHEGEAILADAARIDAFLDGWHPRGDDRGRAARILAAALAADATRGTMRTPARAPRRLATWLSTGFAASAVLGFVLGFTQAGTGTDDEAYAELLLGSTTVMEDFL